MGNVIGLIIALSYVVAIIGVAEDTAAPARL